jgi:hypothetical protein
MCSTTDRTAGATRGARLAMLAGHLHGLSDAVARELSHPYSVAELAALHPDAVAAQLRHLVAAADQSRASAALLTGVVDSAVSRRHLIDGTYASTTRFCPAASAMQSPATRSTCSCRSRPPTRSSASPRLRRALEARDRHCQAPGCHRHVRRCHAHHVQHWEGGGDTSIANCLLLCERHHRALHAGQLCGP